MSSAAHLPALSGSKEADDFIDQQAELIPHNPQTQNVSERTAAEEKKVVKMDVKLVANNSSTVLQEELHVIPTTPPPNDARDKTLYPGDREVIFVGACRCPPCLNEVSANHCDTLISRSWDGWNR